MLIGLLQEYVAEQGRTENNSLSLKRRPGPVSQSVRGNTGSYPFWPGELSRHNQ